MVMNNLNNLMPGIPVDPMAQRQQMQQPNQAVYNNQAVLAKANQFYGTPETMQASVATMEQGQVFDPTGMSVVNQQQIV